MNLGKREKRSATLLIVVDLSFTQRKQNSDHVARSYADEIANENKLLFLIEIL
ncbi:MAG: hypothetical protein GX121_07795 [Ignavibacteria bacterium]|nr:hypothetical protein [Ignavibacteria bacterium]